MAHNLDFSTGSAAIAFLGNRNDIWHRHGQEMKPGQSIEDWAQSAKLEWEAIKVPAIAALTGPSFDHIPAEDRFRKVDSRNFLVRSDNGHPLGYVSDVYQPVQPVEVLKWFDQYIHVDDRFQLDVAGALKKGEIIWATATYRDPLDIAGDKHVARVLMTTTFDGTGSTINQGTMTRVVCNNTLDVATADKRAVIRTRHNTKFNGEKVGKELATLAQGFATYKKLGDALALHHTSKADISNFFKGVLDIPFDAKEADISGRKQNQFRALNQAYKETVREGTEAETAWAALNAITRYVDHSAVYSSKGADDEKRFLSTQFGGGADLKKKAVGLLLPFVQDKVPELIAA
jgi:phage/plasmid-like protein (TIGR03299 family)